MPTFCRHGRVLENCAICSKAKRTRPGTVSEREASRRESGPRAPRPAATRSVAAKRRAQRPGSSMTVRHVARAVDDGYANALVPGLRSSEDARRLAEEIAFAATRLDVLGTDPPGVYGEALLAGAEEGLWLLFLVALVDADVSGLRVSWEGGELPSFDGVEFGPRSADPRRLTEAVLAYRGRAAKTGSQGALLAGERAWTPQRRFDRAFERLALPGVGRAPRYELLLTAGRLGLAEIEPWTLLLEDGMEPVTIAAKRIFGIGDRVLLARRAGELAGACEVPAGALDLALFNWGRAEGRYEARVAVEPDDDVRARCAAALALDLD